MAQYTINAYHCSVFGMDVHARSVTIHGFNRTNGEIKAKRFVDCPHAADIAQWIKEHFEGPYYAAYESGCTGFDLCRKLRAHDIDCDVIAISSLARSTDDKTAKTDKRDAKRILFELLSPVRAYTTVWVPDPFCEAARDLARTRADATDAAKRSKQQLSALLLRHGYVWNEKTASGRRKKTWGGEFWSWVEHISLGEDVADVALRFYIQMVKENVERVAELNTVCAKYADHLRFKAFVDAYSLIKGIDTNTAFLLAAEIGDPVRFRSGRAISKWLGTVPRESSSGEKTGHGGITKAGNSHCRSALIEGACSYIRCSATPKKPKRGHEVSSDIASLCAKANRHMKTRYCHLIVELKKNPNKAKVAIASEMMRWVWAIGMKVKEEQIQAV
jgi:transposase